MVPARLSRLAALALVALLATPVWPGIAARGADDADIPGLPLSGPVVTGPLGGPIYDHVYWVDVPAERVILLALSGDPGTDFDLYLFDSSATTIYSTAGQVASSIGPDSTESIAYATRPGGRFYINVNGASDVAGNFRLTVKLASDTTPPSAQLSMNNGASATQDSTIRVRLLATDDLSGVTEMQFSLDGRRWDEWRAYSPFMLWSFPQVDGPRTLSTRVRDQAGNVSAVASATIVIDTIRPSVVLRSPAPDADSGDLRPIFRVGFSERILPSTWSELGLLVQGPDGIPVRGVYTYDDATLIGTFTPSADLVPGDVYLATIGAVTDLAGNAISSPGTWVIRPLWGHDLTLKINTKSAVYGDTVELHGTVQPAVGAQATLERSIGGRPWQVVSAFTVDGAGDVVIGIRAGASSSYRLHLGATSTEREAFSAPVGLVVRRGIKLVGVSSSTTRRVSAGSTVSLRAVATPSQPSAIVSFAIYRRDPARRTYVLVSTISRTTIDGVASLQWRPTVKGSYYIRLRVPGTLLVAAGVSPAFRWVVQ